MLVDEYAKGIARSGGIGLARSLVAELSRLQVAQAETAP
jgi:Rod binding domain-containing protein